MICIFCRRSLILSIKATKHNKLPSKKVTLEGDEKVKKAHLWGNFYFLS